MPKAIGVLFILALAARGQTAPATGSVGRSTYVNPLDYGVLSNDSVRTTTATTTAGSTTITLASAIDFESSQGIFISHAGAPCGTVRGTACPPAPTPSIFPQGPHGSTPYTYQLACLDGLGGVGVSGRSASTASGPATLSPTSFNTLSWTGLAGCIEVAIYRNGALISTRFETPGRAVSFNDIGLKPVAANRDIPLAPPRVPLNDNLVSRIAAVVSVTGHTATLADLAGATVKDSLAEHSDVPLLQAAFNLSGATTDIPPGTYRVNYPLRLVRNGGVIRGGGTLLMDTNDIGIDMTGAYSLELQGLKLEGSNTISESTVLTFCARDSRSVTSQHDNMSHVTLNNHGNTGYSNGGKGQFAYYNFACEIQNLDSVSVNASGNMFRFTASNAEDVQSPFDRYQVETPASMSQITLINPTGGTFGSFFDFENVYTVNIIGGYGFGGDSASTPYVAYFESHNGNINFQDFRSEGKAGGLSLAPGAALASSDIYLPVFHSNSPHLPQIDFGAGSSIAMSKIWIDDYGGSPFAVALANVCAIGESEIFVGVNETNPCGVSGGNNLVRQVNVGAYFSGPFTWAAASRISGTDLNALTGCGNYDGERLVNAPTAFGAHFVRVENVCSADPGYLTQFAYDMTAAATNTTFVRNRTGGVWKPWELFHGGFSGVKVSGACTFTISNGLITNVTGC